MAARNPAHSVPSMREGDRRPRVARAVIIALTIIIAVFLILEVSSHRLGLGRTVLASLVVFIVAVWGLARSLRR
jgi:hypothetical protein